MLCKCMVLGSCIINSTFLKGSIHAHRCLRRSDEGVGSPGAELIGTFEPPTWELRTELRSSVRAVEPSLQHHKIPRFLIVYNIHINFFF